MMRFCILLSTLSLTNSLTVHQRSFVRRDVSLNASNNKNQINRKAFLATSAASVLLPFAQITNAEEGTTNLQESAPEVLSAPPKPARTIEGCPKPVSGKPNNCVATSNIKQLDTYSPPWTFETSPDEAFARLKGIIKSDPSYTIVEIDDDSRYLLVAIKRLNTEDNVEFLVKADDKVVVFKSSEKEPSGVTDLGANRKRVEELRKKSGGVFGVMGDGLTADTFEGGASGKRNGVVGQLKAFYGLNNGGGYEAVFED